MRSAYLSLSSELSWSTFGRSYALLGHDVTSFGHLDLGMFWHSSQQILSGCYQIGPVGGQPFSCLGESFVEMSRLWKACWRTLLCHLTFVRGVIVSSGGEPPLAHSVVLSAQVLVKYIVIRCPLILTGLPVPATDTSPPKKAQIGSAGTDVLLELSLIPGV